MEPMQRPGKSAACSPWLAQSAFFFNSTQDHQPRGGTTHNGMHPLPTSPLKKMPNSLDYSPIIMDTISQLRFLSLSSLVSSRHRTSQLRPLCKIGI